MTAAVLRHPEKARLPDNPSPRKPPWIRVKAPVSAEYHATRRLIREHGLHTVCEEAACPNIGECWKEKHATVMILGATCTRACTFCNVATGRPDLLDPHEPARLGEAGGKLGLAHSCVTSVGHLVYPLRLVRVEQVGSPGRDVAEGAGAGAGRSQDHYCRVLFLPALADVGARRLLADRVQTVLADQAAGCVVFRRDRRLHPYPRRFARAGIIRQPGLFGVTQDGGCHCEEPSGDEAISCRVHSSIEIASLRSQ